MPDIVSRHDEKITRRVSRIPAHERVATACALLDLLTNDTAALESLDADGCSTSFDWGDLLRCAQWAALAWGTHQRAQAVRDDRHRAEEGAPWEPRPDSPPMPAEILQCYRDGYRGAGTTEEPVAHADLRANAAARSNGTIPPPPSTDRPDLADALARAFAHT